MSGWFQLNLRCRGRRRRPLVRSSRVADNTAASGTRRGRQHTAASSDDSRPLHPAFLHRTLWQTCCNVKLGEIPFHCVKSRHQPIAATESSTRSRNRTRPNTGVHSRVDSLYWLVTTTSATLAHRISQAYQWGKSAGILQLNLHRQSGRSFGTADHPFIC